MFQPLKRVARWLVCALLGAVLCVVQPAAHPIAAASVTHCRDYEPCRASGYSDAGYGSVSSRYFWNMVTGHNCTNYAAYRMIRAGLPNHRPWAGEGDAEHWGEAMARITDGVPAVGAVAWWASFQGGWGAKGHVAYVEKVLSTGRILVSEDIYDATFRWRTIDRNEVAWPTGFIHFADERIVATSEPRILGRPEVGTTLTATPGTWRTAGLLFSYQWLADGTPLRGATRPRLKVEPSMVERRLSLEIEARRLGYESVSVTSRPTPTVLPGRFFVLRTPEIRGLARVGETLTINSGKWRPSARTAYRWFADGRPIGGATAERLPLGYAQVGSRITATVTLRGAGYQTATLRTGRSDVVDKGVLKAGAKPRILGEPIVGATLEVEPGGWTPDPGRRGYLWVVGDELIEGNYGPQLVVDAAYAGKAVTVVEVVTLRGYATAYDASNSLGIAP